MSKLSRSAVRFSMSYSLLKGSGGTGAIGSWVLSGTGTGMILTGDFYSTALLYLIPSFANQ